MKNTTRVALGRLGATLFWLSWLLCFALAVVSVCNIYLDTQTRIIVLLISSIPGLAFVGFYYLYEKCNHAATLSWEFVLESAVTMLVLLLPGLVALLRYSLFDVHDYLGSHWIWITVVFSAVPISELFGARARFFQVIRHSKEIMWDFWTMENTHSPKASDALIRPHRKIAYQDKEALEAFQRTLSCPRVDAALAVELLPPDWLLQKRAGISICDIGGAEGTFTANFITGLRKEGAKISQVRMTDPADWSADYIPRVASAAEINLSDVNVERATLFQLSHRVSSDIVLASHCLYAGLDNGETIADTLAAIRQMMKPEAVAIVVLASRRSRAYDFKSAALKTIFGVPIDDCAGEHLEPALAAYKQRSCYADNIINLTDAIREYDRRNPKVINHWLRYFLRCPDLDGDFRDIAVDLLKHYLVPFGSLHEQAIKQFSSIDPKLQSDSLVLPHKSIIWSLDMAESK